VFPAVTVLLAVAVVAQPILVVAAPELEPIRQVTMRANTATLAALHISDFRSEEGI
jgi:hypothetical protein